MSERNEYTRTHSATGTTLYWHDSDRRWISHGHWATTDTSYSSVALNLTSSSSVEERRGRRLASKSLVGLNSLWTTIHGKSNDPPSKRHKRQRPCSTIHVDISSLDVTYSPPRHLQAPFQSSHHRTEARPDISALVPDYLDLPPPYLSAVQERQEVIDWRDYFDRTPLLTTVYPHSSAAMQDVLSPGMSEGGAWDRVARRLNR